MTPNPTKSQAAESDRPAAIRHIDDMEWETIRWPGETGKMLFHPSADQPTAPNAGLLRFAPGAHHPWHRHDFAQVWYILEGEFHIAARTYGPGTMLYHSDSHYEDELSTETGGLMVIVQYPGPTTGGRPIYEDRFNMQERREPKAERTDL
jgi:hypothetical protein